MERKYLKRFLKTEPVSEHVTRDLMIELKLKTNQHLERDHLSREPYIQRENQFLKKTNTREREGQPMREQQENQCIKRETIF